MSDARTFFKDVKRNPERFYIIHYSSQSLYDEGVDRGGLSPRITSIVVMHFSTRQTVTFAMHVVAEELRIAKDEVEKRYDEIERAILDRFYAFVRDRREKYWVHWNMRNVVYGFEHLEHRYRVLTGDDPPHIPVEVRINLNDVFKERYGSGFAQDPRMLSLMLLNGQRDVRFLEGREEADAFKAKDFIRMHSSTISKVEFFRHVIVLAQQGKLKTAGRGFLVRVDRTPRESMVPPAGTFDDYCKSCEFGDCRHRVADASALMFRGDCRERQAPCYPLASFAIQGSRSPLAAASKTTFSEVRSGTA